MCILKALHLCTRWSEVSAPSLLNPSVSRSVGNMVHLEGKVGILSPIDICSPLLALRKQRNKSSIWLNVKVAELDVHEGGCGK